MRHSLKILAVRKYTLGPSGNLLCVPLQVSRFPQPTLSSRNLHARSMEEAGDDLLSTSRIGQPADTPYVKT